MDHRDLILGELREFRTSTISRLDKIEKKQDTWTLFQGKVIGMAALGAFLATLVVDWLRR